MTGDDGSYALEGITNGTSVLLSYEKSGFVPQSRATAALAAAEASTVINIPMLPVAFSDTFNPALARDIAVPGSTAMVRLPANALRRADGSAPTGQATGRLTPIAPATNVNLMPGNYLAATYFQQLAAITLFDRDVVTTGQVHAFRGEEKLGA